MIPAPSYAEIELAAARIRPHIRETPVEESAALGDAVGARVWLKCEQLQRSGSFKLRGALNRILTLPPDALVRGVVTASTGNHGRAVATALTLVGGRGTVYLPTTAPAAKVAAIRRFPAVDVEIVGDESGATERHARTVADRAGRFYVSPYNDPEIIAGQGTIGLELAAQCPPLDAVFAAVGGGGLISGVAIALAGIRPTTRIIGCWPENSVAMYESMRAGRVVATEERPTLSDGTAGGIEPGTITLDLCRSLVQECVLVSEAEIADALRFMVAEHRMVVEGAAGVAVAAFRRIAPRLAGQRVAIILCGGNIGGDTLRGILSRDWDSARPAT
jgi:threonine dehydratase